MVLEVHLRHASWSKFGTRHSRPLHTLAREVCQSPLSGQLRHSGITTCTAHGAHQILVCFSMRLRRAP